MSGEGEIRRTAARERVVAAAVVAAMIAFFVAWHAPGVLGGRVYAAEDTLAYFASNRSVHHALARSGDLAWWDPLPGLGQPRLANIQNGSLSPFSLLFYALPVQVAFRFHAFLVFTAIGLATFALFRARRVGPLPAAFGALSWCTMAGLTTHFQHPPVIETLVWLPVALFCWERFLATTRARYAVLSGLAVAFQAFGASPQYGIYNALVMALWISETLWQRRHDRGELLFFGSSALGVAILGLGIASWQLLPFAEFAQRAHRELLSDTAAFGDLYRASPSALLRALAAELYWWTPPPLISPDAGYRELPNLSLLTTGLAAFALARVRGPRPWLFGAGALFFLLGMLGSAGGVATLLSAVVPFADRLRAPIRMVVPAGLLLAWLAALGLQQLTARAGTGRVLLAALACGWVALVGWTLKRPLDHYVDPALYEVPAVIDAAPGRVVVDAWQHPETPLFAVNAGLAAGVPTLLQREVLIPKGFFEGYFASQLGSLRDTRRVDAVIEMAALPLLVPEAPLLRSYGLGSIVRYGKDGPHLESVDDPVPRFRFVDSVRSAPTPDRLWSDLRAGRWNPHETVFVREPLRLAPPAETGEDSIVGIEVLADTPDRQLLRVRSPGGLVVTSALLFPGWSVQVDGEPTAPVEVDLALRGVVVPPGEHRVDWRYRPTWLPTAALATVVAVCAGFGLAAASRRRRRVAVPASGRA